MRSSLLALLILAGCPANKEQPDAQTPANNTGPLGNIESSPATPEAWTLEDNTPIALIYYAKENVRVSTSCRAPDGKVNCEALRFMKSGAGVAIPKRSLDGRTSAGIKICRKQNWPIVIAHNSVGAEDSLCKFPDGSFAAAGALEQYALRIIE